VLLLGSLSVFGPLCIDTYLPAFPSIGRDLHSGASQVQLTLTAVLLGIALGQLMIGPISDRLGRRPPLLVGLAAFSAASLLCALTPDVYLLVFCRFVQGVGGAAGIVICRSIVRDLFSGLALVRFFSTLMLATGLGPVFAPQIGSWVLTFTSWRGIFVGLTLLGLALLASAWWRIPETLPPERRVEAGLSTTVANMGGLLADRAFLGATLACALGMSSTFVYVAGSPFVLENIYHLSPQLYGLVFALGAVGMVSGAQVNGALAGRVPAATLLGMGLAIMTTTGLGLVLVVTTGRFGLGAVIPLLFVTMVGNGFVGPNAVALALQRYPHAAGTASALLGCIQFGISAAVAPLAGIRGTHDALPMAMCMTLLPGAALLVRALSAAVGPARTAPAGADILGG
jgi:DHA1 family bicyclomycin/chloramphenicol resistance-like MFS transporter